MSSPDCLRSAHELQKHSIFPLSIFRLHFTFKYMGNLKPKSQCSAKKSFIAPEHNDIHVLIHLCFFKVKVVWNAIFSYVSCKGCPVCVCFKLRNIINTIFTKQVESLGIKISYFTRNEVTHLPQSADNNPTVEVRKRLPASLRCFFWGCCLLSC